MDSILRATNSVAAKSLERVTSRLRSGAPANESAEVPLWRAHVAKASTALSSTAGRLYARYSSAPKLEKRLLQNFSVCVKLHDNEAKGHADRVAYNACLIGEGLHLGKVELETLYWGALLHDLGKIAIPDSILFKPGPLSHAEYAEIKRHPGHGADLIEASSDDFRDIASVVRFHHERWDGGGYPMGLAEEEIPLLSRIVSIVDVFEALTSERPYRRPLGAVEALGYIENQAELHFDPKLVLVFKQLFERGALRVAPRSLFKKWSFESPVIRAEAGI